jgi:biotin carboxyl carrier protein
VPLTGKLKSAGEGWVAATLASDGQIVTAGQPILQLENPEVQHALDFTKAKIEELNAKIRQSRVEDQAQNQNDLPKNQADLRVWQDQLQDAQRREAELTIRAPFAGRLVAPKLRELSGTYVPRGQEIGEVAVLDKLVVKGDIEQKDYQLINALQGPDSRGVKIEVRLAGRLNQSVPGGALALPPAAVDSLADASLGAPGGGDEPVDPRDPNGLRVQIPTFEARVKLDNEKGRYYAGQRAYVRLTLQSRSLAWVWTNKLLQLLQAHDNKKWL